MGRPYREVDERKPTKPLIRCLVSGHYNNPVRIVAFNTSKGWSRDVSEAIAREIRAQAERTGEKLPPGLRDWIDWQMDLARRAESVRVQT